MSNRLPPTHIYIITTARMTTAKIGITNNPESRRKHLQKGNPNELYIYSTTQYYKPHIIETAVKRELKHLQTHEDSNEWFDISPAEMKVILHKYIDNHDDFYAQSGRTNLLSAYYYTRFPDKKPPIKPILNLQSLINDDSGAT